MSAPTGTRAPAAPSLPPVLSAAACAVLAAAVALAAVSGVPALAAAAVVLVQALLLAGWVAVWHTGPTAAGGPWPPVVVALFVVVPADVLLVAEGGPGGAEQLAVLLGLAFLVAVLTQLARRDGRPSVVASLSSSLLLAVLAGSAALVVPAERSGASPAAAFGLAVGAAGLAAAVAYAVGRRAPAGALAAAGAVLGLVLGAAVAAAGDLAATPGVLLGGLAGLAGYGGAVLAESSARRPLAAASRPGRGLRVALAASLPVTVAVPLAAAVATWVAA